MVITQLYRFHLDKLLPHRWSRKMAAVLHPLTIGADEGLGFGALR